MEGVWGVRILVIPAGATRPLRGSASCVTCIGRRGDNTCVCRSELTFSQYVVLSGREMTSARRVLDFRLDLTANPGPSSSSRRYTRFCMPIAVSAPSRVRGSRFGHVFSSVSRSRSRGGLPATRGRRGPAVLMAVMHGRSLLGKSVSETQSFFSVRVWGTHCQKPNFLHVASFHGVFSPARSPSRGGHRGLSRAPPLHRACQR